MRLIHIPLSILEVYKSFNEGLFITRIQKSNLKRLHTDFGDQIAISKDLVRKQY